MSAAAVGPSGSARPSWLFGATSDLLLGCGLAYLAIAVVHWLVGGELMRWIPGGLLILVFAVPHYGATLIRVYESAADRAKYQFFAVHMTIVLALCLAVGSHQALVGSLLLTLYLTWSPWHYTGQNYGVALMLLGRRGVAVDPTAKRWIYSSYLASFVLTFLAMHGGSPGASYAPVSYDGSVYRMLPLGIPYAVANPLMALAALVWAGSLVAALLRMGRGGRVSAASIGPFVLLTLTQSMWFAVPVLLRLVGALQHQPGPANPFSAYGFVWIAAAHSAQYLWITTYYATAGTQRSRSGFLGGAALAGFAVWTVPGLVFAPGLLGGVTYDSGLALLVASIVNLHHFILDGAVWKLRDGAVGGVLLRSVPERDLAEPAEPARWPRALLGVVGAASIAIAGFGFWYSEYGYHRALAAGDADRAERSLEKFAWIGRDGATKRNQVGRALAERGDYERARAQLERSLQVEETYSGHHWLGLVHEHLEDWDAAMAEYDRALELAPAASRTVERRAVVHIERGDAELAVRELEGLIEREPWNDEAREILVRARLAARR